MILLIFALAVVVLLMAAWPKIRSARARLGILSAIGVAALAFYVRRLEPRYVGETEHAVLLLAGVLVVIAGLALVYTLGERGLADARASSDRGQLLWFGIAALVTSAIFAALGAYVRQLNHPQVQAAAVLQAPGRRRPSASTWARPAGRTARTPTASTSASCRRPPGTAGRRTARRGV